METAASSWDMEGSLDWSGLDFLVQLIALRPAHTLIHIHLPSLFYV